MLTPKRIKGIVRNLMLDGVCPREIKRILLNEYQVDVTLIALNALQTVISRELHPSLHPDLDKTERPSRTRRV